MFIHRFILDMYKRFFELPEQLKPFDTYLSNIILALNTNAKDIRYEKYNEYYIKIEYQNETMVISQYGCDDCDYKVSMNHSDYVYLEKFHCILRKKIKKIYKIVYKLCKEKETCKEISSIIAPFGK